MDHGIMKSSGPILKVFPKTEYAKIIDWLHELAEEAWDREIEADSKATEA